MLMKVNAPQYGSVHAHHPGAKTATKFGSLILMGGDPTRPTHKTVGEVFEIDDAVAEKLMATDPPMAVEATDRDVQDWMAACAQRNVVPSPEAEKAADAIKARGGARREPAAPAAKAGKAAGGKKAKPGAPADEGDEK
jgi:hypothetical protein